MSFEVLGGYDVKAYSYRCGIQYVEGPIAPALIGRLIYKTKSMPGQTGRCSLEYRTKFLPQANLFAHHASYSEVLSSSTLWRTRLRYCNPDNDKSLDTQESVSVALEGQTSK